MTKDEQIAALQAKLKDQKIEMLKQQLKEAKEGDTPAKKHVKSNDLFAWFNGKKKTGTKTIKSILKSKPKPLHKPGEWYKDKFGWNQEPDPAEEKQRVKFAKE